MREGICVVRPRGKICIVFLSNNVIITDNNIMVNHVYSSKVIVPNSQHRGAALKVVSSFGESRPSLVAVAADARKTHLKLYLIQAYLEHYNIF